MVDKRVLIIDDDEDIRFTIMEICRSQQWIAREAADYQEAQTVMKEFSPDVILVDYHMPVHDGIWMTREIRKTDRNTSIIVLTIEEKESVVQRFFEAGADDYALKPVKAPDLIARIRLHFKLSEQKRFFKDARKGINEKMNRTPSRGQRKNIKFSRPAAIRCWPLFMRRGKACAFPSASGRPDCAGHVSCCNSEYTAGSSEQARAC